METLTKFQVLVLLRLWIIWDRDRKLMLWTLSGFLISQAATLAAIASSTHAIHGNIFHLELGRDQSSRPLSRRFLL